MIREIEALQQRAVMTRVEEIIQSNPDYRGVQEELLAMDFTPRSEASDLIVWDNPALEILVLLRMNLGGGYETYSVLTYEEMKQYR
jgi:hypothetical protein